MIRLSEVEERAGSFLDLLEAMELRAVVSGDGLEAMEAFSSHQLEKALIGLFDGSGFELSDEHLTSLAFDKREDAGLLGMLTHDGIDLPMTEEPAVVDGHRSLINRSFPGQPSS